MAEMRLDIYLTDLTPEAQDRVRKFYGIPDGEYDNFDIFPLANLWKEVSDEEAEAACGLRRSNYEPDYEDEDDEDEDEFDKFFCFEDPTSPDEALTACSDSIDDTDFLSDLQAEQSEQG